MSEPRKSRKLRARGAFPEKIKDLDEAQEAERFVCCQADRLVGVKVGHPLLFVHRLTSLHRGNQHRQQRLPGFLPGLAFLVEHVV